MKAKGRMLNILWLPLHPLPASSRPMGWTGRREFGDVFLWLPPCPAVVWLCPTLTMLLLGTPSLQVNSLASGNCSFPWVFSWAFPRTLHHPWSVLAKLPTPCHSPLTQRSSVMLRSCKCFLPDSDLTYSYRDNNKNFLQIPCDITCGM